MASTILRLPAVITRTGLSRSTIYLFISNGTFPPSLALGSRAVGWLESDIEAWLISRMHTKCSNASVQAKGGDHE